MKKYPKKYPPEIRAMAVERLKLGHSSPVVQAYLNEMGITVSTSSLSYWRNSIGMTWCRHTQTARPSHEVKVKPKQEKPRYIDRKDLEMMAKFNMLVGFMRPLEKRA